jgi:hypothetical protein
MWCQAQLKGGTALVSMANAIIRFEEPQQLEEARHTQCLAGYCSALWGALPRLTDLEVYWPTSVHLVPQLPAASALQQLSRLVVQGSVDEG